MCCTVHSAARSFVEVVHYLTTLPGAVGQYVLSECFSQDPLDNYFSLDSFVLEVGCVRTRLLNQPLSLHSH